MDPSLISAGASLFGGFLGDRQRKKDQRYNERMIAQQNAYNAPDAIRARAEKAGFNPLLFMGPGVGLQNAAPQALGGNYLGAAIADAGLMAADALARQPQRAKLNAFQTENAKLKAQVQNLTLRPKVGGLYAERVVTPSIPKAVNRATASQPDSVVPSGAAGRNGPSAYRPLSTTDISDPRREVDNQPVKTSQGFMVIDSPYLGAKAYAPTLDGDEPLQWYDYPSLAIPAYSVGLGMAYNAGLDKASRKWKQGLIDGYKMGPPRPPAKRKAPKLATGLEDLGF